MMLHIPEVFSAVDVRALRARVDAGPWLDGRATAGEQGAHRKRNLQLDVASEVAQLASQEVLQRVQSHPLFFSAALPLRILAPLFNRYEGGGEYGEHVDGAVMSQRGTAQRLRSDVSATLFLCEPDEYDGGELIVRDTYGEHEVKLPAGDLIVYPSSSLHRVAPVTRGARLAAFFWVQSLVRDQQKRQMLLELDTSIQQLTRDGADRGALLRLTGVYHNLLRRWSET